MSNLIEHAKKELELAGLYDKDSDYGGALAESVIELIETFSKQGHSGGSAGRVVSLFNKLANYKTITPLTGDKDEWNEVSDGVFQNKRNSAVFKDGLNGKAYYLNAIIWKNQKGFDWNGNADGITSRQHIKAFPFQPKTFVIDVLEEEVKKDDWLFHIKNKKDLKKVFEVYEECQVNKTDPELKHNFTS